MEQNLLKKFKIYFSIRKEKQWLEEMALKGWKLKDMIWGMWYTFERIEPKKLVYEMDRFYLPKHPTLKEIKHKDEFLAMAEEMGWETVVHDEDLNYYFCKEYQEDDINELHNDIESRQQRAETYRSRFRKYGKNMNILAIIMAALGVIWILAVSPEQKGSSFLVFLFTYVIVVLSVGMLFEQIGEFYYREFMLTQEQWSDVTNVENNDRKVVRKLLFLNKTLIKFLREQSTEGWHICCISGIKYIFNKGEPCHYEYNIDAKFLVNRRNKQNGLPTYSDHKDWAGLNNDWQIQSIKDADKKNWEFVCALENKAILYRSKVSDQAVLLNDKKRGSIPFTLLTSKFTMFIFTSGMIGFICGIAFYFIKKYV